MRRVREDRQLLGGSADMSDMRGHALLRQFTESTRKQTRARQQTSGDCVSATRGALALLLSRRSLYRILSNVARSLIDWGRNVYQQIPSSHKSLQLIGCEDRLPAAGNKR